MVIIHLELKLFSSYAIGILPQFSQLFFQIFFNMCHLNNFVFKQSWPNNDARISVTMELYHKRCFARGQSHVTEVQYCDRLSTHYYLKPTTCTSGLPLYSKIVSIILKIQTEPIIPKINYSGILGSGLLCGKRLQ